MRIGKQQHRLNGWLFYAVLGIGWSCTSPILAQDYRIERIASGLDQPTYITQAPGDPANILYFTERVTYDGSGNFGGFGAVNNMGKVWRYDVSTRTKSLVLDISTVFPTRTVTNDTGVQTIAFSADFNTPGAPTYQKMFISYSERGTVATNHVEEYDIGPTGTAAFNRRILRYTNSTQNNHTVNWIGFDPTASGKARNFLYISTGDGAFGNAYNGGAISNGRPSQNPASSRGKMARVDVSGGDDYDGAHTINGVLLPNDADRSFKIPLSNPLTAYNAAHPGSPIAGRDENFMTGLRNVYRASFDRATGDIYMGDVGENAVEEISFFKAGTNAAGPPADFGWPQLEGITDSNISGAPHTTTNPFTGVTSLYPIQQFSHSVGLAAIGGYVYRGPIASLQGKYFYADFAGVNSTTQNVRMWMLDFDRNTNPASYNGANGTVAEVSSLLQSLVVDPSDPSYVASSSPLDTAGIDHFVSFGEDNAGNVYIVDFGNRTSPGQSFFDGQYPNAGLGEIFRLTRIIKGDFNFDQKLTNVDLQAMLNALKNLSGYKTLNNLNDGQLAYLGDLNGADGLTAADIPAMLNLLTGQMNLVPEPASALLGLIGAIGMLTVVRTRRGKFQKCAGC